MCIACELGYLSMIDALEAERRALTEKDGHSREIGFVCETPAEPIKQETGDARQRAEEPHRECIDLAQCCPRARRFEEEILLRWRIGDRASDGNREGTRAQCVCPG